jgi:hypothetical protein
VSGLVLIFSVKSADGHAGQALDAITSMSFAAVLLLIAGVIVATTLTQAFEFEAIRLLEGYWGPGPVQIALAELLCRWQTWRRARLIRRHDAAAQQAFDAAMPTIVDNEDLSTRAIKILRARVFRERLPTSAMSPEELRQANAYDWLKHVPATPRRRLDAMAAALRRYPAEDCRILPSRLGNALRYHEERVHDRGIGENELEHYVEAVFDELPATLKLAHDQHRARLDVYCSLVLVFALTGVIGIGLLATYGREHVLATAAAAAVLTWLSYRAAIASASAYGGILELIVETRPPGITRSD